VKSKGAVGLSRAGHGWVLQGWARQGPFGVGGVRDSLVIAWQGQVGCGWAWPGLARTLSSWWRFRKSSGRDSAMRGMVRSGEARSGKTRTPRGWWRFRKSSWLGSAPQGGAGQGTAGRGKDSFSWWRYANSQGTVRQGKAMQCLVRSGTARHGKDSLSWWQAIINLRLGRVWRGWTMLGAAGRGPFGVGGVTRIVVVGQGEARHSGVRSCVVGTGPVRLD
jgi:hypothetical protein